MRGVGRLEVGKNLIHGAVDTRRVERGLERTRQRRDARPGRLIVGKIAVGVQIEWILVDVRAKQKSRVRPHPMPNAELVEHVGVMDRDVGDDQIGGDSRRNMSSRILPGSTISVVVLPLTPICASAGWISLSSTASKLTPSLTPNGLMMNARVIGALLPRFGRMLASQRPELSAQNNSLFSPRWRGATGPCARIGTMNGVFISYRRDDAPGYAGRLYDRLAAHFGADRVFMDVQGIEPRRRFVEAIERALARAKF